MERLETGSMPLVGSSKKINREFPIRAMQTLSLRFWPPDSDIASHSSLS
jgi:hypothetical protein